jgi:hypothetical protein
VCSANNGTLDKELLACMTRMAKVQLLINFLLKMPHDVVLIRKLIVENVIVAEQNIHASEKNPEVYKSPLLRSLDALNGAAWINLIDVMFALSNRSYSDADDFAVLVRSVKTVILLTNYNLLVIKHSLALFIRMATRFRRLFKKSGYVLVVPIVFQVAVHAEQSSPNGETIRSAVTLAWQQFYRLHQESFIFQALNSLLPSLLNTASPGHAFAVKTWTELVCGLETPTEHDDLGVSSMIGVEMDFKFTPDDIAKILVTIIGFQPQSIRAEQAMRLYFYMVPHLYTIAWNAVATTIEISLAYLLERLSRSTRRLGFFSDGARSPKKNSIQITFLQLIASHYRSHRVSSLLATLSTSQCKDVVRVVRAAIRDCQASQVKFNTSIIGELIDPAMPFLTLTTLLSASLALPRDSNMVNYLPLLRAVKEIVRARPELADFAAEKLFRSWMPLIAPTDSKQTLETVGAFSQAMAELFVELKINRARDVDGFLLSHRTSVDAHHTAWIVRVCQAFGQERQRISPEFWIHLVDIIEQVRGRIIGPADDVVILKLQHALICLAFKVCIYFAHSEINNHAFEFWSRLVDYIGALTRAHDYVHAETIWSFFEFAALLPETPLWNRLRVIVANQAHHVRLRIVHMRKLRPRNSPTPSRPGSVSILENQVHSPQNASLTALDFLTPFRKRRSRHLSVVSTADSALFQPTVTTLDILGGNLPTLRSIDMNPPVSPRPDTLSRKTSFANTDQPPTDIEIAMPRVGIINDMSKRLRRLTSFNKKSQDLQSSDGLGGMDFSSISASQRHLLTPGFAHRIDRVCEFLSPTRQSKANHLKADVLAVLVRELIDASI